MGFDATRKLPSEGYQRGWPELVRMDERVRAKIDALGLK
jgi:4-hydroxy-3-polyprenylbenzoate decarboxylase